MKIKIQTIIRSDFNAAFKALCNLPVKNAKDVLNLATASRRMRQAAEVRNEFYTERLKVWATQSGSGWKFNDEAAANSFEAEMREMDAKEIDTKLPGKVALDEETFKRLTAEQIGLLVDYISVPESIGKIDDEEITLKSLMPAK